MSANPTNRPVNHLAGETSPYLLQHVHNPVDWYPWGEEALNRARVEDKPIFLSVGYSACHWCHVMERESFEDPAIAAILNEHFVSIKVDREERPDIDQIYMNAVQAIAGQGGWPMSVWLTPDGRPFYGGTYFPPTDRYGRPGFAHVLRSIAQAWRERRDQVSGSAEELTRQLQAMAVVPASAGDLDASLLDNAARYLARIFEPIHGGFGDAPKFPQPMALRVLLRHHARTGDAHSLHMVRHTLEKMARGGIYDHLGGGFARYSTDDRWLVPHFEKMLYDNALLTSAYLEAFQATGEPEFERVVRETIGYVLGRMTDPDGALYATEDADSEGVEGKYYVWTRAEVDSVLGPEAGATFAAVYDVGPGGNWEGHAILNQPRSLAESAKLLGRAPADLAAELAQSRWSLREVRERRVPPSKDTKVLVGWNGLMIAALADAGRVLSGGEAYLDAAARASGFILDRMRTADGRLLHGFKDGRARFHGYLDDYAAMIDGLTRLFEATGEPRWIQEALALAEVLIEDFQAADGGFFQTGKDHETLIVRQKDVYDNATPSGNGLAASALARLSALTGREDLEQHARSTLRATRIILEKAPAAAGQSLIALDFLLGPEREVAIVAGADPVAFWSAAARISAPFRPGQVLAPAPGPVSTDLARLVPLLADRPAVDGQVTTYFCQNRVCDRPIVGLDGLAERV